MESPAPGMASAGGIASSPMLTPLSMDLTNNSSLHGNGFEQQQAASKAPSRSPRKSPRRSQQQQQAAAAAPPVPASSSSQEFTRNITGCVPALSTLVEEDEDGMLEGGGGLDDLGTAASAYDDDCMLSPAFNMTPNAPEQGGLMHSIPSHCP